MYEYEWYIMTQKIQLEINALVFELWIVCDSDVLTDGYLSFGMFLMVSWTYFDWWMHSQFLHFFETQCFVACWLFIRSLHHRGHFVGTLKPRLTTLLRKFNALIHLDLRYFWTRSLLVWHQPTSEDKNKYLRFSTNENWNFLIHGFADEKCS